MAATSATRVLQGIGLLAFATGGVLLAIGTTSIPLFVVYALVTFGGAGLFLAAKKLQQRSAR